MRVKTISKTKYILNLKIFLDFLKKNPRNLAKVLLYDTYEHLLDSISDVYLICPKPTVLLLI